MEFKTKRRFSFVVINIFMFLGGIEYGKKTILETDKTRPKNSLVPEREQNLSITLINNNNNKFSLGGVLFYIFHYLATTKSQLNATTTVVCWYVFSHFFHYYLNTALLLLRHSVKQRGEKQGNVYDHFSGFQMKCHFFTLEEMYI